MDNLLLLNKSELGIFKINKQMAEEKGLIEDNDICDMYLKVQSLYKKAFDTFLEKNLNISEIDKKLKETNLDYGVLKENQKTIYQRVSYLKSKYIFVRNFFFIERLSEKDINIFIDKIKNNDFSIDESCIEIVTRTFKDITKVLSNKTQETFKVFYGYAVPCFEFDNDAIVFYINYGKNTIELRGKEFFDNKAKKEKYLDNLIIDLKEEYQKKLNCKVELNYYKGVIF